MLLAPEEMGMEMLVPLAVVQQVKATEAPINQRRRRRVCRLRYSMHGLWTRETAGLSTIGLWVLLGIRDPLKGHCGMAS